MEIAKKYDELLQRFTELKKLSAKAQLESERALNIAGMLGDAVKAAQASASNASNSNCDINTKVKKIQELVKLVQEAYIAIQKTQQNFEAYVSHNIQVPSEKKPFKIFVSSRYGEYIVIEGDGIPFDKTLAGYEVTGYIVIPKGYSAVIDDSGYENTFWVSDKIKTRINICGSGKYRHVRSGECHFK